MEAQEKSNFEETIKEAVQGLVSKMGFAAETEIKKVVMEEGAESIVCNIKTEDSNFLIGQYGVNLQSLQHIARLLVRKKTDDRVNFIVDVNSYRQEKNDSIEKMAAEMAEQAIREQRALVLRPMSPYERRLVHLALSENAKIKTESIGDGEDRKVVIKPVDLI
jgi:spoIIIJ-associated protein